MKKRNFNESFENGDALKKSKYRRSTKESGFDDLEDDKFSLKEYRKELYGKGPEEDEEEEEEEEFDYGYDDDDLDVDDDDYEESDEEDEEEDYYR